MSKRSPKSFIAAANQPSATPCQLTSGPSTLRARVRGANRSVRQHRQRAVGAQVRFLRKSARFGSFHTPQRKMSSAIPRHRRKHEVVPVLKIERRILVVAAAIRPCRRIGERREDRAPGASRLVAPGVGRAPVEAALAVRLDHVPPERETHDTGVELRDLVGHLRREHAGVHAVVQVRRRLRGGGARQRRNDGWNEQHAPHDMP